MARFDRFRMARLRPGKPRLLLGIHPLPTMVTLGNLVCGFVSIMLATHANTTHPAGTTLPPYKPEDYLYLSGLLIFAGMLFDLLDGGVARLTKSTSKFGMELDSLCDVVSFGVAPAVLVYNLVDWQINSGLSVPWLERYLFPMLLVYVSCATLRLARYNVESESGPRGYFFGMPSPGAAGCAAGLVLLALPATHHWQSSPLSAQFSQLESYLAVVRSNVVVALPFVMVGLGIMMVSRVHYQPALLYARHDPVDRAGPGDHASRNHAGAGVQRLSARGLDQRNPPAIVSVATPGGMERGRVGKSRGRAGRGSGAAGRPHLNHLFRHGSCGMGIPAHDLRLTSRAGMPVPH
jgi:CDP-diacylglycerol--serine O-phosphatidyltransferase